MKPTPKQVREVMREKYDEYLQMQREMNTQWVFTYQPIIPTQERVELSRKLHEIIRDYDCYDYELIKKDE